jgi:hypothetical protein
LFGEKEERDLFRAMTGVKSEDFEELAWLCIYTANRRRTAGAWGNNFLQFMRFGEITKSVLKS